MQEETQPCTFAAACRSDAVHAIVPIAAADEWETVGPRGEALVDRSNTMFEECSILRGPAGLSVSLVRIRRKQRCLQKRHPLVQHAGIARRADVLRHHVRQPQQVVRAT